MLLPPLDFDGLEGPTPFVGDGPPIVRVCDTGLESDRAQEHITNTILEISDNVIYGRHITITILLPSLRDKCPVSTAGKTKGRAPCIMLPPPQDTRAHSLGYRESLLGLLGYSRR